MEDRTPPVADQMVYISDYSFTVSKLLQLEERICRALDFRLHRSTPFHSLHVFCRAASPALPDLCGHVVDSNILLRTMTLYLLELSRADYSLTAYKPSIATAACVFLARATLGIRGEHGAIWTPTLQHYTECTLADLTPVILKIHRLHLAAELSDAGTAPAFTKYRDEENFRVSLKTVPRIESLGLATNQTHDDTVFLHGEENYVVML
jgi:Cyclin, C-terminal domain